MNRLSCVAISLAVTCVVVAHSPSVAAAQATPPNSAIDPDAITALNDMGAYLRGLKEYQVKARVTSDDVLTDGQRIQYTSATDMLVRNPDRLLANVVNDRIERTFLYDGKSFTLWAPRVSYYATVDAPATIRELLTRLDEKYEIEMPFVDLFLWGTPKSSVADIKAATDIGPSVVENITCEQYAFRQDGLDWQIWIQKGSHPLPLKLVLTTLTDEARPQHMVVYTWNLAPSFNDAAFVFVPPPDAKKITFMDMSAARTDAKKK
jgi:hypothetical protein